MPEQAPLTTPLHALHHRLGGRMVTFAGYDMPVQFPQGVREEHLHTRARAGLFDVSHMGPVRLRGPDPAAALERLVPGGIATLGRGRARYTLLTGEDGGILDDLIVTNMGDHLYLVVNAARKAADLAHLRDRLDCAVEPVDDHGLLALQGPAAAQVLSHHADGVAGLAFMAAGRFTLAGADCIVSRCGYTGEDGFEILVPGGQATELAERLLDDPAVAPIGLGARDSLRLEAGLCLYGQDIDESTTPVEANLAWAIPRRRREEGGFPGAEIICRQLQDGPPRLRVGIRPEGRAPARAGTEITDEEGRPIGRITSGGFGPSVGGPVAMGYVAAGHAVAGARIHVVVRGRPLPARIADLPFVKPGYHRG